MAKRMLIDASHPEETRVVVIDGNKIEEYDFESTSKQQLKGNIYLAKVTRVEPSLQASFVEYGGTRHGFLAFSEIHPDYYRIPVADREALLQETFGDSGDDPDDGGEEEAPRSGRRRRNRRSEGRAAPVEASEESETSDEAAAEGADGATDGTPEGDAETAEKKPRRRRTRRPRRGRNAEAKGDDANTDGSASDADAETGASETDAETSQVDSDVSVDGGGAEEVGLIEQPGEEASGAADAAEDFGSATVDGEQPLVTAEAVEAEVDDAEADLETGDDSPGSVAEPAEARAEISSEATAQAAETAAEGEAPTAPEVDADLSDVDRSESEVPEARDAGPEDAQPTEDTPPKTLLMASGLGDDEVSGPPASPLGDPRDDDEEEDGPSGFDLRKRPEAADPSAPQAPADDDGATEKTASAREPEVSAEDAHEGSQGSPMESVADAEGDGDEDDDGGEPPEIELAPEDRDTAEDGEITAAPASKAAKERGDVESVGGHDEVDEISEQRSRKPKRVYKIQEVVKRRQIMLVQVNKEERGNKGAALSTYLSLAGRYCVLMPNTPRGGGISRKISNPADRKKMKSILEDLDLPEGMAVILRTAGLERTKTEIKRDLDYLLRLWDQIREKTLSSIAPCLIHEEANLIKRAIRDLYAKDIEEVLVQGEEGFRIAKDFMKMMMPSHAKKVQLYRDEMIPLFHRYQVENQMEAMLSPTVQLKSGGYIVINPTEALVAIDVNSGRATKERNIEETAYRTNLEAADEVARQLRLRDLAGLVVVDFIDMEEDRHNSGVERRLKEAMKSDRARIQVGRISPFGLLELSRQRLRPSLLETHFEVSPYCGGTGMIRTTESSALLVLRAVVEEGIRKRSSEIMIKVPTRVAIYILNQKRDALMEIEQRYEMRVVVEEDRDMIAPNFELEKLRTRAEGPSVMPSVLSSDRPAVDVSDILEEDEDEVPEERDAASADEAESEDEERGNRRRRRPRRRRRNESEGEVQEAEGGETDSAEATENGNTEEEHADAQASADDDEDGRRKRRRGKRGGRRRRGGRGDAPEGEGSDEEVSTDTASDATPNAGEENAVSDGDGETAAADGEKTAEPETEASAEVDGADGGAMSTGGPAEVGEGEDAPKAGTDAIETVAEVSPAPKPETDPVEPEQPAETVEENNRLAREAETVNQAPEKPKRGWWQRLAGR